MFRKFLSIVLVITFVASSLMPIPKAHASTALSTGADVLNLPVPGTMVNLSPAYEPALIKGLTVHQDNPFLFDFIVDTGNSAIAGDELKKEGDRMVKYFFACLTIPEKDLWVNLSPYEKDRMVPQALGQTALGRDLLAQDYILKQLTASLIYPEKDLGKAFWDKVYTKAQQLYGTTEIPVNTLNKVWIVADKASVYEHGQTAFVVSGHMKVMLEEDYLALEHHQGRVLSSVTPSVLVPARAGGPPPRPPAPRDDAHTLASDIVRQIILPELEKEVNTGKNFSALRQIFNSLILASWYKKNLKEALLTQVYADKSTVKGVNLADPSVKEQIYQQYLKAYKKGVFNYIKEDTRPDGQTIPRKYFSGGFDSALVVTVKKSLADAAEVTTTGGLSNFAVGLNVNNTNPVANPATATPDVAMNAWAATNNDEDIGRAGEFVSKNGLFTSSFLGNYSFKAAGFVDIFFDEFSRDLLQRFLRGNWSPEEAIHLTKIGLEIFSGMWLKLKYNLDDDSFFVFYHNPTAILQDGKGKFKHPDGTFLTEGALEKMANDATLLSERHRILKSIYSRLSPELSEELQKMAERVSKLGDDVAMAGENLSLDELRSALDEEIQSKKSPNKAITYYNDQLLWRRSGQGTQSEQIIHGLEEIVGKDTSKRFNYFIDYIPYIRFTIDITDAAMLTPQEKSVLRQIQRAPNTRVATDIARDYTGPDKKAIIRAVRARVQKLQDKNIPPVQTGDAAMVGSKSLEAALNRARGVKGEDLISPEDAEIIMQAAIEFPNHLKSAVPLSAALTIAQEANRNPAKYPLNILREARRRLILTDEGIATLLPLGAKFIDRHPISTDSSKIFLLMDSGFNKLNGIIELVIIMHSYLDSVEIINRNTLAIAPDNITPEQVQILKGMFPAETAVRVVKAKVYWGVQYIRGDNTKHGLTQLAQEIRNNLPDAAMTSEQKTADNVRTARLYLNLIRKNAIGTHQKVEKRKNIISVDWEEAQWALLKIDPTKALGIISFVDESLNNDLFSLANDDTWNKVLGMLDEMEKVMPESPSIPNKEGVRQFIQDLEGQQVRDYNDDELHKMLSQMNEKFNIKILDRVSPDEIPFNFTVLTSSGEISAQDARILVKSGIAMSFSADDGFFLIITPDAAMAATDLTAMIQKGILLPATVRGGQLRVLGEWYSTHPVPVMVIAFLAAVNKPATPGEVVIPDEISKAAEDALFQIYSRLSNMERIGMTNYLTGLQNIEPPAFSWLQGPKGHFVILAQGLNKDKKEAGTNTIITDAAMTADHFVDQELLNKVTAAGLNVAVLLQEFDQSHPRGGGNWRPFLEMKIAEAKARKIQTASGADKAVVANPGGIDLNASSGMQWKVSKDGKGVEMNIDPAMIERVRREGIDSLSPVIFRITPVTSIWPLVGLQEPVPAEHLAGV